eukprot:tig00000743_g3878.t1
MKIVLNAGPPKPAAVPAPPARRVRYPKLHTPELGSSFSAAASGLTARSSQRLRSCALTADAQARPASAGVAAGPSSPKPATAAEAAKKADSGTFRGASPRSASPAAGVAPAPRAPAFVPLLEPKNKGSVKVLLSNGGLERAEINKSQIIQELRKQVNLRNIGQFKRIFMGLSCGTGTCPKEDFIEALVQFGVSDRALCYRLFKLFDTNGSGDIDFAEFELGIARTLCEPLDRVLFEYFNDRGLPSRVSVQEIYRMLLDGSARRARLNRADLDLPNGQGAAGPSQTPAATQRVRIESFNGVPPPPSRPSSMLRLPTQPAAQRAPGPKPLPTARPPAIKGRSPLARLRIRAAFWAVYVLKACGDRQGRLSRDAIVIRAVGDRVLRFVFKKGMGWEVDGVLGGGQLKMGAVEDEEDGAGAGGAPFFHAPLQLTRRPMSLRKPSWGTLSSFGPAPPVDHSARSGGVPVFALARGDASLPRAASSPQLLPPGPLSSSPSPRSPAASARQPAALRSSRLAASSLSLSLSASSSFSASASASPSLQELFSDYSITGADPRRLLRQRRPYL